MEACKTDISGWILSGWHLVLRQLAVHIQSSKCKDHFFALGGDSMDGNMKLSLG